MRWITNYLPIIFAHIITLLMSYVNTSVILLTLTYDLIICTLVPHFLVFTTMYYYMFTRNNYLYATYKYIHSIRLWFSIKDDDVCVGRTEVSAVCLIYTILLAVCVRIASRQIS